MVHTAVPVNGASVHHRGHQYGDGLIAKDFRWAPRKDKVPAIARISTKSSEVLPRIQVAMDVEEGSASICNIVDAMSQTSVTRADLVSNATLHPGFLLEDMSTAGRREGGRDD